MLFILQAQIHGGHIMQKIVMVSADLSYCSKLEDFKNSGTDLEATLLDNKELIKIITGSTLHIARHNRYVYISNNCEYVLVLYSR